MKRRELQVQCTFLAEEAAETILLRCFERYLHRELARHDV